MYCKSLTDPELKRALENNPYDPAAAAELVYRVTKNLWWQDEIEKLEGEVQELKDQVEALEAEAKSTAEAQV